MRHRNHTTNSRQRLWVFAILAASAVLLALGGTAQTVVADDGTGFDGMVRFGYRFVDVGGTETKYQEDINLEEGVRLFELDFDWRPEAGEAAVADRVSLDIDNYGGDPFESLHFSMQKFGRYDFRYDRTKSAYFYEDTILPIPLAGDPAVALAGDFHHFDFDRVRDSAQLTVRVNPRAKFLLGIERFTKEGLGSTTFDISRDEFEFEREFDESYDEISAGFEYAWDKATFVFEETYRQYENDVHQFLPGGSLGEDPLDASTLFFYTYDTPYEFDSLSHTVRLNARPTDRWLLSFSGILQSLDMTLHAFEEGEGTAFNGSPLFVGQFGDADIERDTELFDVDFTYLLSDRFALVGGARSHTFDQQGESELGTSTFEGDWDVETTGLELGFEATVGGDFTIAFGGLSESRDVTHDDHAENTDNDGLFFRASWRPTDDVTLQASYEDSSYDDPFTLTSPTDRTRFKLSGKYQSEGGFWLDASFLSNDFENTDSGWDSTVDQLGARFGYRKDALDLHVGYTMIETERFIDQTIVTLPGFGGGQVLDYPPIFYDGDSDFLDARVRYRGSERVAFGADVRLYENSGTFGIERDDLRAFVEIGVCEEFLVNLAYRTIDFDETDFDFDDYDADIFEASVGYRF